MKKQIIILGSLLTMANLAYSQWTTSGSNIYKTTTGNVGIGNASPIFALDITSSVHEDGIRIQETGTGQCGLHLNANTTGGGHRWSLYSNGSANSNGGTGNFSINDNTSLFVPRFVISGSTGNVGIGTTSPQFKLDVNGTLRSTEFHMVNGSNSPVIDMAEIASGQANIASSGTRQLLFNYYTGNDVLLCTGSAGKVYVGGFLSARTHVEIGDPTGGIVNAPTNVALDMHVNDGKAIRVKTWNNALPVFELFNTSAAYNNVNVFTINGSGAVQIGRGLNSTSPHYNTTMLSVEGKVVCSSLYVRPATDWPDYVFTPEHKLNSLEYLDSYIKENKHLPNIPSAKEIEANGINVSEMSVLQMEKIEELTLYVIELKKEMEILKKKVNN